MSKYTKALEKLQEERDQAKAAGSDGSPGLRLPAHEDEAVDNVSSFERGITTIKNTNPDSRLIMLRFPDSMLAEQYRMFRTSLKAQLTKQQAQVILVSSSIHSEGKTVTATNLALSLAENGEARVALIDADLRRGNISDYMGFGDKKKGLTELLREDLNPKQVMCKNSLKNLVIIPRGEATRKSAELVSSSKLQYFIRELRHHFDYIIIDSPPIMSVADAGILGKEVDGVLFVIQVGRTPKSVISHAQVLFKQAGAKMLGYVLTNVEFSSPDYRYYNYYDEYSDEGRNRAHYHFKRAGFNLKDMEERFQGWWEKAVLKKERTKNTEQRL
ncbi:MAG: CpsD/CapB family tyrosine-protein kinase [Candidatus Omnitrophica bacterium]|nr:CpsD/CapB family tyrosine-protein kinase [Candidatus Omnitrophota bacterium]